MSDLRDKYEKIVKNLEQNLKNKEDIDFVKGQISELVDVFSRKNRSSNKTC